MWPCLELCDSKMYPLLLGDEPFFQNEIFDLNDDDVVPFELAGPLLK